MCLYIFTLYICKFKEYTDLFYTVEANSIISSIQSLSRNRLFGTLWTAAGQDSLSITKYLTLPKLMSIESVMPTNCLILYHPLLLLLSIFPSIRVFSNKSALRIM